MYPLVNVRITRTLVCDEELIAARCGNNNTEFYTDCRDRNKFIETNLCTVPGTGTGTQVYIED